MPSLSLPVSTMENESESLFFHFVQSIFKKWIGLQAALDEGMGGPYAKEKVIWMGKQIENYFRQYGTATPDELEELIAIILENEFDTYVEDGSVLEISQKFCQAYVLSTANPQSPIFDEVHQELASRSSNSYQTNQAINHSENSGVSVMLQPSQNEVNPESSMNRGMEQLNINGANGTTDDAWTFVTRKNHKR